MSAISFKQRLKQEHRVVYYLNLFEIAVIIEPTGLIRALGGHKAQTTNKRVLLTMSLMHMSVCVVINLHEL